MREEAIRKTFEIIDQSLRSASVARIGGFGPTNQHISSWFGGGFQGRREDDWPEFDGAPALPLLQVRCDELPFVPGHLQGIALLNVFISAKGPPAERPAPNGTGWLIRTYPWIDDLVSLRPTTKTSPLHAMPVRWTRSKREAPGWDDAWLVTDLDAFNKLPDAVDLFFERYASHPFTKVGGWPSYIRDAAGDPSQFVLQIASEEKPRWMLGENGNIYVFKRGKDDWILHWDSY